MDGTIKFKEIKEAQSLEGKTIYVVDDTATYVQVIKVEVSKFTHTDTSDNWVRMWFTTDDYERELFNDVRLDANGVLIGFGVEMSLFYCHNDALMYACELQLAHINELSATINSLKIRFKELQKQYENEHKAN